MLNNSDELDYIDSLINQRHKTGFKSENNRDLKNRKICKLELI